jgi:hypothetical protein
LRRRLEEDFGEEWFRRVEAGKRLKRLWSAGQRRPVEEMARKLGYRGLEFGPLFAEMGMKQREGGSATAGKPAAC